MDDKGFYSLDGLIKVNDWSNYQLPLNEAAVKMIDEHKKKITINGFNISIYRSDDMHLLNKMVEDYKLNTPVFLKDGTKIGKIVRVWRDGMLLMGFVELTVPSEI